MPRKPKSLLDKIARFSDAPRELIEATMANPRPASGEGPCWRWQGAMAGMTPVVFHNGRPQSVRRLALAEALAQPLAKRVRVLRGCASVFCVSPNHAKVLRADLEPEPPPIEIADGEDDPIEDVIDAVYSREPPWNAEELAAAFNYPVEKVREAIRLIEAGQY